jgi:MoaA/NifB/PqqE/SkfB family radical SAM enzyme
VSPCAPARLSSIEWQLTRPLPPSDPAHDVGPEVAGEPPPSPHATPPDELTTPEGRALLAEAASLGAARVLLTGRDPTRRPDLPDLIAHGSSLGLPMHLLAPPHPAALLATLPALRDAGLRGVAAALQGPDGKTHDVASGAPGSFAATVDLLQAAREQGLEIDVRTSLSVGRSRGLPAMAQLVAAIGASRWTVIAPLGDSGAPFRALALERLLITLADLAAAHRFEVTMVAAPHLARVVRMRHGASPSGPASRVHVERDGIQRLFISATGEVFPSAQLPIPVAHVRSRARSETAQHPLTDALDSPLLTTLRAPHDLTGKCGVCSFQKLCGGSRARAFTLKSDLWAEDPACSYVPKKAPPDPQGP